MYNTIVNCRTAATADPAGRRDISPQGECNVKPLRSVMFLFLLSLGTMAFAQTDPQRTSLNQPAPSEAQKSFTELKALAGTWKGQVTMNPPMPEMADSNVEVSLRITSRGNALVHEMKEDGKPADPAKYDNPVTMFYLDGDRLLLTHYCDAGNRPRMVARTSPDGKTVEFDFLDVSGNTQRGMMNHMVFTVIDANHHSEAATYMLPGNKSMVGQFVLTRTK